MKKIAFFREKRFENNNFYNTNIDENLSPFKALVDINGKENTISYDQLDSRDDKDEFIILCWLTFSLYSLLKYLILFIKYRKNRKYYVILEPIVVAPLAYSIIFHKFFEKILTWKDSLVDNNKYIKIFRPQSYYGIQEEKQFGSKKFTVLINANKWSMFHNELYSERIKIVQYFENNNKNIDVYWSWRNKPNFKQKILGFQKITWYKWRVENKIDTISSYKFNICFENMKDTPWYITEKIRDSLKAKTIPIYRWASNITDYIPENCFIDYRKYIWNNEELLNFLENMTEESYNNYIKNIEIFLDSDAARKWFDKQRAENFITYL